ncbi:MAG TPA: hypothetical protein VK165_10020 [Azonexus sp.]|nr:hypothetical protein [Azonexus sp.]
MAKIHKTVHCKLAQIPALNGSLQAAIAAELSVREKAADRLEQVSVRSGSVGRSRVIAQSYDWKGALAGIMLVYEPGSKAAALIKDMSAKQLAISHFSAPDDDATGAPQEWVEGMIYFMIRENFVVFTQSAAVRSGQLEQHLTWLLTKSETSPIIVTLSDRIPKDVEQLVRNSHVKSIFVGGSLMSVDYEGGAAQEKTDRQSVKLRGPMLDAVKAAIGGDQQFRWLDGLDGNLEAKLELTFKRDTTTQAQQLLDNLAVALRHLDGVDTDLLLANGQKISHDQLRLMSLLSMDATDGVPNVTSVFESMYGWLSSLANNGQL